MASLPPQQARGHMLQLRGRAHGRHPVGQLRGQQAHAHYLPQRKAQAQAVHEAEQDAGRGGVQLALRVRRERVLGLQDGCGQGKRESSSSVTSALQLDTSWVQRARGDGSHVAHPAPLALHAARNPPFLPPGCRPT